MRSALRQKKGQGTLEYAILIAVVVAALIAMQVYMKRGIQGKLRSSTDDIGDQFSPGYTTGTTRITSRSSSTERVQESGVTRTDVSRGEQDTTVDETVADFDSEYWPE